MLPGVADASVVTATNVLADEIFGRRTARSSELTGSTDVVDRQCSLEREGWDKPCAGIEADCSRDEVLNQYLACLVKTDYVQMVIEFKLFPGFGNSAWPSAGWKDRLPASRPPIC
jgi:hypothetical protein